MRSRLSPWLTSSQRSLRRISAKTAGQVCTVPAVGDDAFVLPAKPVQLSCDKALMFQCCLIVHPAISRGSFAHPSQALRSSGQTGKNHPLCGQVFK